MNAKEAYIVYCDVSYIDRANSTNNTKLAVETAWHAYLDARIEEYDAWAAAGCKNN